MSRKKDLEDLIQESYNLIHQYEEMQRTSSDPKEKERCHREIADQWTLIEGYWHEYAPVAGSNIPSEIAEIGNHFSNIEVPTHPVVKTSPPPSPSAFARPPRLSKNTNCPFLAGPMIQDPRYFVGRKTILRFITQRMTGVEPTSVNLYGERRIGKSSLLYYFVQTYEQRVSHPERYAVVYLSLQGTHCHKEMDFYSTVAKALAKHPAAQRLPKLALSLKFTTPTYETFRDALSTWKSSGILPVLCLDEFEMLFRNAQPFDDGFFDRLRALMDAGVLMLIAASHEPLDHYAQRHRLTSTFFNNAHLRKIGELEESEAGDLVRLPASTVPGQEPALDTADQHLARLWGGRHPYLLHLAGLALWETRQQGLPTARARAQYHSQAKRLHAFRLNLRHLVQPLRWLVWDVPVSLGHMAQRWGKSVDDMVAWSIGIAIVVILALTIIGVLTREDLMELLHQILGR